ncbi:RES family NAD+ phosphorylase [bacterium]|nr:RES family NAD+ phosphorylase [bacterium]
MRTERLPDGHRWLRVADPGWGDPVDTSHASARGGRWNPPGSFRVLYCNEDIVTARLNTQAFLAGWPYEADDLRDAAAPVLVAVTLPRNQRVADLHSPSGLRSMGLPPTYPLDGSGDLIDHDRCQPVGSDAYAHGLRGVRCRSARTPRGAGRELAWFPATARSRARIESVTPFSDWYWA